MRIAELAVGGGGASQWRRLAQRDLISGNARNVLGLCRSGETSDDDCGHSRHNELHVGPPPVHLEFLFS
jgi:hypothetical protein